MDNPKLIITLGDPNSIGPEIVIKALDDKPLTNILLVGARNCLVRLDAEGLLENLVEVGPKDFEVQWGKECEQAGRVAYLSLIHI